MNIVLKPKIAEIVEAQVAAGEFANVEDAVAAAVLGVGLGRGEGTADLSWAKPYVDDGLADLAAGRTIPADEVHSELRRRFGGKDKA